MTDLYQQHAQENRVPTLAFAVAHDGNVVAEANGDVAFRLASMTKSFTAAAVLLLRDRKLLRLDDEVAQHVPELQSWALPTLDSPTITIRHLLTMSSGLATDDTWADRQLHMTEHELSELMRSGGHFATPPDHDFVYCNYGYGILGRVISNVSGVPFRDFVSTELLQPLGMTSTTWDMPTGAALPHRPTASGPKDEGQPAQAPGAFASMGGLWSTTGDVTRWMQFFIDAYPARSDADSGPLCRASRREMQSLQTRRPTFELRNRTFSGGYGMGLLSYDDPRMGRLVTHSGGLPGYGSNMMWLPHSRVAAVVMANVTYVAGLNVNLEVLELLHSEKSVSSPVFHSEHINAHGVALVDLLNNFTEATAAKVFADNVLLDSSFPELHQQLLSHTGRAAAHRLNQCRKPRSRDRYGNRR